MQKQAADQNRGSLGKFVLLAILAGLATWAFGLAALVVVVGLVIVIMVWLARRASF